MSTADNHHRDDERASLLMTLLLVALFVLWICATAVHPCEPLTQFGTPEGTVMIDIPGHLCGAYDGRSRCARWKLEYLTPHSISGPAVRSNKFAEDGRIPKEFRATLADYRAANGFDRGHESPYADHVFSQKAADATFLLSNMTPQVSALNEVLWNHLEAYVRSLVKTNCQAWVITLPIYAGDDPFLRIQTVGASRVWVPTHYAKSVLLLEAGEQFPKKLESWLVPNEVPPLGKTISSFTDSIDHIETVAGLDLWSELPEPMQSKLEASE